MSFFEKDYIEIWYSRKEHFLVLKWLDSITTTEFREGMNALIEAMEYFKTGKVIYDLTLAGALHPDDQHWAVSDWQERAVKAGQSHVAIVLASDIFAQMAIIDTMNDVTLPTASFDSLKSAIDWIRKQGDTNSRTIL